MIAPVLKLRSCQHTRHNPHLVYRSAQMRIQPGFQVCIFRVVEQQESEHKHHHDNGPSVPGGVSPTVEQRPYHRPKKTTSVISYLGDPNPA